MKEHNIETILDLGCGDWQFSQYVHWGDREYIGIDCVKSVIDDNVKKFLKPDNNLFFCHLDINDIFKCFKGVKYDLVILKDVLQHWDNEHIINFMDKLTKQGHKHILIINSYKEAEAENRSIKNRYVYAKLDALKYPLNRYNPQVIYHYRNKQVSVIKMLG